MHVCGKARVTGLGLEVTTTARVREQPEAEIKLGRGRTTAKDRRSEEGTCPIHLGTQFANHIKCQEGRPAQNKQLIPRQPKERLEHPGRPPRGGTLHLGSSVDGCLPGPGPKGTSKLPSPGSNLHWALHNISSGKPAPARSMQEQEIILEENASPSWLAAPEEKAKPWRWAGRRVRAGS